MSKPFQGPQRCHLLEDLPPELRLRIYDHVYSEDIQCRLYLRNWNNLEQPMRGHGIRPCSTSLFKTCKTVYEETAPVLYERTEFEVNIFYVRTSVMFYDIGSVLNQGQVLRQIRHLVVGICLFHRGGHEERFRQMEALARGLETAEAELKTLSVVCHACPRCGGYNGKRSKTGAQQILQDALERLGEDEERGLKRPLYRTMLEACEIGDNCDA